MWHSTTATFSLLASLPPPCLWCAMQLYLMSATCCFLPCAVCCQLSALTELGRLQVAAIALLLLLFRMLSTTAEDFFSPILTQLSQELGLPPRFAGGLYTFKLAVSIQHRSAATAMEALESHQETRTVLRLCHCCQPCLCAAQISRRCSQIGCS